MTEALNGWVLGIVGAAMISAITLTITPEGSTKRVVSIACGFIMLLALIRPLRGFDYGEFRRSIASLRADTGEFTAPMDEVNENLTRRIIEEKLAAYILDKGAALGIAWLEVTVSVTQSDGGLWYPDTVAVTTDADNGQKSALAYEIEAALGIPTVEIKWGDDNEKAQ